MINVLAILMYIGINVDTVLDISVIMDSWYYTEGYPRDTENK